MQGDTNYIWIPLNVHVELGNSLYFSLWRWPHNFCLKPVESGSIRSWQWRQLPPTSSLIWTLRLYRKTKTGWKKYKSKSSVFNNVFCVLCVKIAIYIYIYIRIQICSNSGGFVLVDIWTRLSAARWYNWRMVFRMARMQRKWIRYSLWIILYSLHLAHGLVTMQMRLYSVYNMIAFIIQLCT